MQQRRATDISDESIDKLLEKSSNEEVKVLSIFVKRVVTVLTDMSKTLHEQHIITVENQAKIVTELHSLINRFEIHEKEDSIVMTKALTSYKFWQKIIGAISTIILLVIGGTYSEYMSLRDTSRDTVYKVNNIEKNLVEIDDHLTSINQKLLEVRLESLNLNIQKINKKKVIQASR